jgi:hypothetical protein
MASEDVTKALRHRGHMLRGEAHARDASKYLETLKFAALFVAIYGNSIREELDRPGGVDHEIVNNLVARKEYWQDTAIFAEEGLESRMSCARQEELAALGEYEPEEYDNWPYG